MDSRRATLVPIAVLTLADMAGAASPREAWSGRHNKAASVATHAARAKPAVSPPVDEASAVHAGI